MGKQPLELAANAEKIKAAKPIDGKKTEYRIRGHRGLTLVVLPSGTGTFSFRYSVGSGQDRKFRQQRLGRRDTIKLSDAVKKANTLRLLTDDGRDPVAEAEAVEKEKRQQISFSDLAEMFLDSGELAKSSERDYRLALDKDVLDIIGDKTAKDVTKQDVLDICRGIRKRVEKEAKAHKEKVRKERGDVVADKIVTEGLGRVQADKTRAVIGGVFSFGERELLVDNNPTNGLKKFSDNEEREREVSDAEISTVWHAINDGTAGISDAMRYILMLIILTGQRRTECAGSQTKELEDLGTGQAVWTIEGNKRVKGAKVVGRTKNKKTQHVYLSKQAEDIFLQAIKHCAGNGYVFPVNLAKVTQGKKDQPRTPHIHGESVSRAFKRLCDAVGIEDLTVHDMRRAISNWMVDACIAPHVVERVLSHSNKTMTMKRYANTARMEPQLRAAMQAWADHVWAVTGQGPVGTDVTPLKRAS